MTKTPTWEQGQRILGYLVGPPYNFTRYVGPRYVITENGLKKEHIPYDPDEKEIEKFSE